MDKAHCELFDFWNRSRNSSPAATTNILSSHENQQGASSASSETAESIPLFILDTPVNEVEIVSTESPCSSIKVLNNQQVPFSIQDENNNKSQSKKKSSTGQRRNYLSSWEKHPEALFKSYVFDQFGNQQEKFSSWLYFKENVMRCSLCEKHGKRRNTNGELDVLYNYFTEILPSL